MMETPPYAVFLFPSVSHVLKAEKILKARGTPHKLIPVPRHIGSDCGVCLRVAAEEQEAAAAALQGKVIWERTVLL
jgi:bacterioferritin-associated ferredoxin